jgi:hypothetical protein
MSTTTQRPLVVGWKEHVAMPELGIRRLRAKIDTGAKTSALDVASYELRTEPSGRIVALLRLALRRRAQLLELPVVRMVVVCNSGGYREQRPVVETLVCLGPVSKRVLLTVTNRSCMRFRMILGRSALAGDFVVDVSRKYLLQG